MAGVFFCACGPSVRDAMSLASGKLGLYLHSHRYNFIPCAAHPNRKKPEVDLLLCAKSRNEGFVPLPSLVQERRRCGQLSLQLLDLIQNRVHLLGSLREASKRCCETFVLAYGAARVTVH